MRGYYEPTPSHTDAYHNDGTHEYFGKAAKGSKTSQAVWQIVKMVYNTGYSVQGDPWIMKYPADPDTSKGTDAPKFKWTEVATLTYKLLGDTA